MKPLVLLVLSFLPFIGASDFQCRSYSDEQCRAGDLECCYDDEDPDPINGYILDTAVFTCEGRITEWTIDAAEEGTMYACVFEPYEGGYKLLGYNKLVSIIDELQAFQIPLEEQLIVRPGYRIGVVYDETAPIAVLWAAVDESADEFPAFLINQFRHTKEGFIDLHVGHVISTGSENLVALRTTIEAKVQKLERPLRLWPHSAARSGRAELSFNGVWGTFCDRWFQLHGWALTFCRCSGYPEDIDVRYVKDLVSPPDPVIDPNPDLVIHKQSPRQCTLSWNRTLQDCPVHPRGKCDHNEDVYVKCHSKWKCEVENEVVLSNGCKKTICRPQYWIETMECWSNVCETRGHDHLTMNPYSWVRPFCIETGFTDVGSAAFNDASLYEDDPLITDVTCPGGFGTDINDCQTRFRKDENCPFSENSGVLTVECIKCFT